VALPHSSIFSFHFQPYCPILLLDAFTFMNTNILNSIFWFKMLGYAAFLLIIITADFAHSQGTIISVSGPAAPPNGASGFNGDLGVGTSLAGVSWSSTAAFTNVNISVALQGDTGATGVAYLTTRIGSGTTIANQIASASFAFPSTLSLTPVFSGLNLSAGTYFLIIQQTATGNTGNGVWQGTTSPTLTSAAYVTATGEYWYYGSFPSYVPSSTFGRGLTTYYDYTVTSVPEPSATWLILLGGGVAILGHRRNRVGFWK
jgi:hypothetical protein